MKIDPNSPAFPHDNQELGSSHRIAHPGMTVRTWLAGKAMEGMCRVITDSGHEPHYGTVALRACAMADEMIARLNEGEKP